MKNPITRRSFGVFLAVALFYLIVRFTADYRSLESVSSLENVRTNTDGHRSQRVAKVSMLYGDPNTLYERALESHRRHARRWGYPMHVLQQDIAAGFWNKPSYLLALVIQELSKPPAERVEWLMWVDADSIIINPAIPAEIFLPPSDLNEIHMVASKDHNGLNTGIFFLHVHPWAVSLLVEALAHPLYRPEIDLGRSADQEAMARLAQKTTGGPDGQGYKEGVVYLPRPWINTYEWLHAYEGKKGDMLVHFPGLEEARWSHMEKWLDIVEQTPLEWEVPLDQTDYPNKTTVFWTQFRTARDAANRVEKDLQSAAAASENTGTARSAAVARLRNALQENADDLDLVQQRLEELYVAVETENARMQLV